MDMEKMQAVDAAMKDLLALQGADPGPRAALAGLVGLNSYYDDFPDEEHDVCMVFGMPLAVLEKAGALSRAIRDAGRDFPMESLTLRASEFGCGSQTWESYPDDFPLSRKEGGDDGRVFRHGDAYAALPEAECTVLGPQSPLHPDADLRLKVDGFGIDIGYPPEFGDLMDCRLTVPQEDVREILDLCRRAPEEAESESPRP